ncbi:MAG: hypothetical protein JSR17_10075 [Proteobacteria bacterium]|nr:hypothetical protein [Pseudomonadota bacterium]
MSTYDIKERIILAEKDKTLTLALPSLFKRLPLTLTLSLKGRGDLILLPLREKVANGRMRGNILRGEGLSLIKLLLR